MNTVGYSGGGHVGRLVCKGHYQGSVISSVTIFSIYSLVLHEQDCLHAEISWEEGGLESGKLRSRESAVGEDATNKRSDLIRSRMLVL